MNLMNAVSQKNRFLMLDFSSVFNLQSGRRNDFLEKADSARKFHTFSTSEHQNSRANTNALFT